ncbi:MAG: O-antigen ligase family protein, partial [Candidatus Paceibacterota bacterium]
ITDVLLLWVGYALFKRKHLIVWRNQWLILSGGILFLSLCLSSFLGIYLEKSLWSDILRSSGLIFLTHLALFSVMMSIVLKYEDWFLIRRAITISAGIYGFLTLIGTQGLGFEGNFLWVDLSLPAITLGNTTFAGVFLLLTLVVGIIEMNKSWEDRKWRKIIGVSLGLVVFSPIMMGVDWLMSPMQWIESPLGILGSARASSATMFIGGMFIAGWLLISRYLRSFQYIKYVKGVWAALFIVFIVVGVGLLFTPGSLVQEEYIEQSTAARIIIWESSWEAFKDRPIIGWGPENFNSSVERFHDKRLYLKENIGEVWFDRAHNVIMDTLVTRGLVGIIALFLFAFVFLGVIGWLYKREKIGELEAVILAAFIPAHFLQLQTGFDTIASYTLIAFLVGYVLWLSRGDFYESRDIFNKGIAVILLIFSIGSLIFIGVGEFRRQLALKEVFIITGAQKQLDVTNLALSRISDWEGLRLTSSSFIKGSFFAMAQYDLDASQTANIQKTAEVYSQHYLQYLNINPNHYRANMNYAYLLLFKTIMGDVKLDEAQEVVTKSYDLSPNNPLTYGMDALVALYGGDIERAQQKVGEMLALDPQNELSQEFYEYIYEQSEAFPNIEVIKLENI